MCGPPTNHFQNSTKRKTAVRNKSRNKLVFCIEVPFKTFKRMSDENGITFGFDPINSIIDKLTR